MEKYKRKTLKCELCKKSTTRLVHIPTQYAVKSGICSNCCADMLEIWVDKKHFLITMPHNDDKTMDLWYSEPLGTLIWFKEQTINNAK